MKDTFIASNKFIKKQWFIVDANGKCLGRLATEVVKLLRGKTKIYYNPSQDLGDYVIIINANKICVSGNKSAQKLYMRHSGRPGGKKVETFEELKKRLPNRILEKAIKGMLPKNRLGRKIFTNLKVYEDQFHPHQGQQPSLIEINEYE
jgi:large subunit ribosomal protein L13